MYENLPHLLTSSKRGQRKTGRARGAIFKAPYANYILRIILVNQLLDTLGGDMLYSVND
jgi:hypothetical protein